MRLDNFRVTNGPDLHVLLSPGFELDAGYEDLARLKGNVGYQNYPIPVGVDVS